MGTPGPIPVAVSTHARAGIGAHVDGSAELQQRATGLIHDESERPGASVGRVLFAVAVSVYKRGHRLARGQVVEALRLLIVAIVWERVALVDDEVEIGVGVVRFS